MHISIQSRFCRKAPCGAERMPALEKGNACLRNETRSDKNVPVGERAEKAAVDPDGGLRDRAASPDARSGPVDLPCRSGSRSVRHEGRANAF